MGLALPNEERAATGLLNLAIEKRNGKFVDFLTSIGGMGVSRERAVLESMWYQGQSRYLPSNGEITKALREGNRAEVWYQIRYESAKNGGGVITRRYAESAYFGLYDSSMPTDKEAKEKWGRSPITHSRYEFGLM